MEFKFKVKPGNESVKKDEDEEPVEENEEVIEEVEESIDDIDEEVSGEVEEVSGDDYEALIYELAVMMKEQGEGSVRDYLYNKGYEFDEVDSMISDIHKLIKSGAKVDGTGMYCSGGVETIVDEDTEFADVFEDGDEDEDNEKPKKKSLKKSEFDDPVEEVYEMLKEGDPIPIRLAEKLLGNKENFDRLMTKDGVMKSKYQVFMKSEDEIEEAAK